LKNNNQCLNGSLILKHLLIDQIYLFNICFLAAMLQFTILITNFEYDQCITEYLKSTMTVTIDNCNHNALFDRTTSLINNQYDQHQLICDIYPNGL